MYNDETEQLQFVKAITDLETHSGWDCPEYAFKGMLRAIYEGPRWGSPLYVFTDAYPKDATEENIDEVEALAAEFGITINFFTTGGLNVHFRLAIGLLACRGEQSLIKTHGVAGGSCRLQATPTPYQLVVVCTLVGMTGQSSAVHITPCPPPSRLPYHAFSCLRTVSPWDGKNDGSTWPIVVA